ncbi:MAG: hypothetical protein KDB47_13210 [Mycobacterium sp.]|nr:hypothetical protein [Mycobacterium sp.]
MTAQAIDRPTPPPAPCTLDRHRPNSRVGWQYWSKVTEQWEWVTGTAVAHRGEQRLIEIRVDATGRTVWRPCGYIAAAPQELAW